MQKQRSAFRMLIKSMHDLKSLIIFFFLLSFIRSQFNKLNLIKFKSKWKILKIKSNFIFGMLKCALIYIFFYINYFAHIISDFKIKE